MDQAEPNLGEVEGILGYRFKNKNLLTDAFTHSSYSDSSLGFQRLELVGDSVLNCMMTKQLFFMYPHLPSGSLTRLRSDNTDNEKLARVAVRHGLYRYIRHRKPQIHERIEEFRKSIADYPLHSHGLIVAPKILADVVESIIGAVFVDCNCSIEIVWKVFQKIIEPFIGVEMLEDHPVARLQDICQKNRLKLQYVTGSWEKDASVEVLIENRPVGKAFYGMRKDVALNRAAKDALENLEVLFPDLDINDSNPSTTGKDEKDQQKYKKY